MPRRRRRSMRRGRSPEELAIVPARRSTARVSRLACTSRRALLLLVVALVNGTLRHHAFTHELSQWDGLWYRMVADHGYPTHVIHAQSTLGFFPVYPLLIWAVSHAFVVPLAHYEILSSTVAGLIVSGIGGLVATVLVQRLATGWWGERTGRKAVLIFCLFPGSVVFSMVYAEGVVLALAAGCILALQQRRWLLAGALAGIATATEPEAIVLVVVCAVSAALELRRRGVADPVARRSLIAPALSVVGVARVRGVPVVLDRVPVRELHRPARRVEREDRRVRGAAPRADDGLADLVQPLRSPDD